MTFLLLTTLVFFQAQDTKPKDPAPIFISVEEQARFDLLSAQMESAQSKFKAALVERDSIRLTACLRAGVTEQECGQMVLNNGLISIQRIARPAPPVPPAPAPAKK